MVKFMRDNEGRVYTVKDGKVTGIVDAFGDNKTEAEKKEKKKDTDSKKK